ncbi:MAG: ferrochelatase [Candidatus Pacebacteria bacterium]|nr:ferrochelatase [Candidatus Paceibacterota bacterium]
MTQKKTAVILFNLGGPDSPKAVRPFLINLFSDPAILQIPSLVRKFLARLIAYRRTKTAVEIYNHLGGFSPILINTQTQLEALSQSLQTKSNTQFFIAMRYWHPMTTETIKNVIKFMPDQVILLPLYPQYSMTTTGSSVKAWLAAAKKFNLAVPTKTICCYPTADSFIQEVAKLVSNHYGAVKELGKTRILFSAHGLPKQIIQKGDPYQNQIEQTSAAVVKALNIPNLDWKVTYQSRVGPLEWIGPSTEDEIKLAGSQRINLVICPIAFVSEHSETLVELDIEYRAVAKEFGVPHYRRVPTVGSGEYFINALCELINRAEASDQAILNHCEKRFCPPNFNQCPYKNHG